VDENRAKEYWNDMLLRFYLCVTLQHPPEVVLGKPKSLEEILAQVTVDSKNKRPDMD
jgi:hypothetical protein